MWFLVSLVLGTVQHAGARVDPSVIWQIGKAVWNLIENNQPTSNVTESWAGAVPKGITDWTQLSEWRGPYYSENFYMEFKNHLGTKLTRFDWNFEFHYNGSLNGTGLYVTEAGVSVQNVYATLTEHVDVIIKALNPVNYGSASHPIGGLDLLVRFTSHGLFERTTLGCTMTVMGNGTRRLGPCQNGTHVCLADQKRTCNSNEVVV